MVVARSTWRTSVLRELCCEGGHDADVREGGRVPDQKRGQKQHPERHLRPPTPGQRRKDAHTSLAAALSAPRGHEDYDFTTMV